MGKRKRKGSAAKASRGPHIRRVDMETQHMIRIIRSDETCQPRADGRRSGESLTIREEGMRDEG